LNIAMALATRSHRLWLVGADRGRGGETAGFGMLVGFMEEEGRVRVWDLGKREEARLNI
jgi:hypothetical protein